jgi:uncharacterized protein (TIGR02996 family)
MTTEDDFQRALDAHPDDWQTRLVFADWLQDGGDPRADGYRALVACGWSPWTAIKGWYSWWDFNRCGRTAHETPPMHQFGHGELPTDWFDALGPRRYGKHDSDYPTRREAEDAAALAFAKLPPERRAELLAREVTT